MQGTLYRAWAEVKARLGGSDESLVETAGAAEDESLKAYKDALDRDLPLPIRQLLVKQQTHILSAAEYLRTNRESRQAA